MKIWILLTLLNLIAFNSFSQSPIDSLNTLLDRENDPSKRFEIYLQLSKNLSNPNELHKILQQCELLLGEIQSDSLKMGYYRQKGVYYGQVSNDSANYLFNKALELALDLEDSMTVSTCYNGLGNVARRNGALDNSLEYFINAKKYVPNQELLLWRGDLEANIAGVYYSMRDLKSCLRHTHISLSYYEQDQTPVYLSYGYTILGFVYRDLENYDSAIYYNEKALAILAQSQDTIQIIFNYMTIASLAEANNDIKKSQEYIDKIIPLSKKISAFEPLLDTYNLHAKLLIQQGKFKRAQEFVQQVIELGEEKSLPGAKIKAHEMLALIYASQNQPTLAFAQINKSTSTRDSIRNVDVGEKMAELDLKYETEKKESEITRLALENEKQSNQRNVLIFSIGILIIIVLFVLVIIISKNKVNKSLTEKNQLISTTLEEREVLLKEIHHRVKNNLQIVSSLLNLQSEEVTDPSAIEAVKEGQNRVKSMALIHQKLYMNDNLAGIKIKEYLETLTTSLMSSYTELTKEIDIKNQVEDISLDVDTSIPLALILNELITNSIKYAFPEPKNSGVIEVTLRKAEDKLFLEVKDNGIGMTDDQTNPVETNSFGLRLVKSLCRKLKADLNYDFSNGTSIQLQITRFQLA